MITRSGIEVAMDAEAERPVVEVFRQGCTTADQERAVRDSWSAQRDYADRPGSGVGALQLGVHHVETHVEVLGDVPLRPRTNPPSLPVHIAADVGRCDGWSVGASAQE